MRCLTRFSEQTEHLIFNKARRTFADINTELLSFSKSEQQGHLTVAEASVGSMGTPGCLLHGKELWEDAPGMPSLLETFLEHFPGPPLMVALTVPPDLS